MWQRTKFGKQDLKAKKIYTMKTLDRNIYTSSMIYLCAILSFQNKKILLYIAKVLILFSPPF